MTSVTTILILYSNLFVSRQNQAFVFRDYIGLIISQHDAGSTDDDWELVNIKASQRGVALARFLQKCWPYPDPDLYIFATFGADSQVPTTTLDRRGIVVPRVVCKSEEWAAGGESKSIVPPLRAWNLMN